MVVVNLWGYRSGRSEIRDAMIANTAVSGGIKAGDILIEDQSTTQYFTQGAAGSNEPRCVALVNLPTIPTNDGDVSIPAEFSEDALYEYPADTGTVTAALIGKTMDMGGPQSMNIDAGIDNIFTVHEVNLDHNSVIGKFNFSAGRTVAS